MRERVYGPYREPNGSYRVVVDNGSARASKTFASEAQADKFVEAINAESEGRTVSDAVDTFIAAETARGLKTSTTDRQRFHLRRILQLNANGHRAITWLTPTVASRLYLEAQRGAVDTHRGALAVARQFGAWCATKGWIRSAPFEGVKGRGRRKHGKPQLRIDEGRRFLSTCLDAADHGDTGAIATLGYLWMAIRNTELVDRLVRDLDDDCRVLWVDDAKCEKSKRPVPIPELLRPYFRFLARDKLPGAPLFQAASGRARSRDWATDQVPRLCKLAGVSRVTPHGLRGCVATWAKIGGAQDQAIANALGHDLSMTRRHYFDRQAIDEAQSAATLTLLTAGAK
jgi:integrase